MFAAVSALIFEAKIFRDCARCKSPECHRPSFHPFEHFCMFCFFTDSFNCIASILACARSEHFGSFHKPIICVFYFGQKSLECSPLVPQKFTLLSSSVLQRTSQQCGFSSCMLLGSAKAVVSSRVKRAVSSALLNMQMRFADSMPVPLYPTVV